MEKEKIDKLFSELLKELATHNYERTNDFEITDFRDDVIILAKKWDKFRGFAE